VRRVVRYVNIHRKSSLYLPCRFSQLSSSVLLLHFELDIVGSLKLYVSFAKEPYKGDYILQKRPIIWRSLLIVATPYVDLHSERPYRARWRCGHTSKCLHWRCESALLRHIEKPCRAIEKPYLASRYGEAGPTEYSLFDRALLQKRPIIGRSLLIVAAPYVDLQSRSHIELWGGYNE